MNIALLGYGLEGKSSEKYFTARGDQVTIFDNFTAADIPDFQLDQFDLILRSPSVPPVAGQNYSSQTKYFFDHCPAPIIGVTGTKGKGTTCTLIATILEQTKHPNQTVHLVGNIGKPALDQLDNIKPNDIVVFEMSSFQLWDLEKSPHIAVILRIEPDHLNVHKDYAEYVSAKTNIARHQTAADYCIYFAPNPDTTAAAKTSPGQHLPYPPEHTNTNAQHNQQHAPAPLENLSQTTKHLQNALQHLTLIGQHNAENAIAALTACAAYYNLSLDDFLTKYQAKIATALENCHGLPHRLELVRTLKDVVYYDDSFCTNAPSQQVALASFPDRQIFLIAGGRDKTMGTDLPDIAKNLTTTKNLAHVYLIGESGRELAKILPSTVNFSVMKDFASAITRAHQAAQDLEQPAAVLLSPAAASFDMFDSAYDRGDQFKQLVNNL